VTNVESCFSLSCCTKSAAGMYYCFLTQIMSSFEGERARKNNAYEEIIMKMEM